MGQIQPGGRLGGLGVLTGPLGWQTDLAHQQGSRLSSLVVALSTACGAKAFVPKMSCPTGTESPVGKEHSKQLGLS